MNYELKGRVWMPRTDRRTPQTRRAFLSGVGAAAGATVVGQNRAEANPLLWIGGVVLGWAIGKVLDSVWDSVTENEHIRSYAKSEADPSWTPVGRREYDEGHSCDCKFGKYRSWASASDDTRIYFFPQPIIDTLGWQEIDANYMFARWGAPTDIAFQRELDDGGTIGGQWYTQIKERYVVFRTFREGRDPVFLSCLNSGGSNYSSKAQRVVENGEIQHAGPRLRNLIENPSEYKFLPEDRPEYS